MTEFGSNVDSRIPDGLLVSVRDSVSETISSVCGFDLECKINGQSANIEDGVVGIISFVGDIPWTFLLALPRDTSSTIAEKLTGFEIDYESDDMGDVVGELANIIAGDTSAKLEGVGIKAQMGIPSVTRGSDMNLLAPDSMPTAHLEFTTPDGNFWVRLMVGEN